jgi:hypothetical protein
MKYNLIFSGIQEKVAANKKEKTVLTEFLTPELGITNANEINLQNVHMLRCIIYKYLIIYISLEIF